jgi:hypothetical protein
MRAAILAACAAALACGACAQDPVSKPPLAPTVPLPKPAPAACDAARYAHWIGSKVSEIDLGAAPRAHRVVCADCAMTMDFSADRLTIFLDADQKVARLSCQ